MLNPGEVSPVTFLKRWLLSVCWTSLYGHNSCAHSVLLACPSAQISLHSALYFRDYCQHLFPGGSNNVFFFFQVNEGQLTSLNFPKKASTRQKLRAFLFLTDWLCGFIYFLDKSTWDGLTAKLLLKHCTLLCRVEEWEAQAVSNILSVS